ncbi:hypothetical protein RB601_003213 [Gaeumannomyces tritici]
MATRKLNILIYTGSGAATESIKHAVFTLRRLLAPNYAVSTIGESALLKESWAPTCAMLVFPGGADLGYCRVLNGPGNAAIAAFVRRGGRYLGFCAGAYYGSARCEFEVGNKVLEVAGPRELAFFPGTCRGGAFAGFQYHSEAGARAALVRLSRHEFPVRQPGMSDTLRTYYNGGGVFVDAAALASKGVHVLAEYEDEIDVDGGSGRPAAAVHVTVGNGHALLFGLHPEFSPSLLPPQSSVEGYDKLIKDLTADEEARTAFLRACLTRIGLDAVQEAAATPSPTSLHLTSATHQEVSELLHSLEDVITKEHGAELIKAEGNTFRIVNSATAWSMSDLEYAVDGGRVERGTSPQIENLFAHEEGWPNPKMTPAFNHALYYSSLQNYRRRETSSYDWGSPLMYGEVVTSTNTILETNPKLLAKLPTGFTLAATTQTSGRGRGNNVWIAPPGALIFSTVINHPAHLVASRPIVFIQYVASIALIEAIQSYGQGYSDMPVRLKWPNDIYCRDPTQPADPPQWVKIGGMLANCSYASGNYQVVLGIGINTSNPRPTTSLDALAEAAKRPPFQIEQLLARILTRIEALYNEFISRGFTDDLEERYYKHWLHSDQLVTLEAEGGVRARIAGITRDWGMLKAEELGTGDRPTGRMWALQSDENSFDFWKGLVKRKT